ncbi:MAG: OmpA family protein [Saprospiraceae bacterium]
MKKLILFMVLVLGVSFSASSQGVSSAHEVYFAVGSSALNADTKATLNNLADRLKKSGKKEYEVLVYGYADPTGDEKLNLKLSISRINSVADYIESKGIPKNNVVRQIPRGEVQTRSKYVNTEKDLDHSKRRSVELLITPSINTLHPEGRPSEDKGEYKF